MSRRSSVAGLKISQAEISKGFEELFDSYLNKSRYAEARDFAGKKSRRSKEERSWHQRIVAAEKMYCTELDEHLIPATWGFSFKKRRTADEEFRSTRAMFEPFPELEFMQDYCSCRIELIKLFTSLYQAVGSLNLPSDFQQIYELFHRVEESTQTGETTREKLGSLCSKHDKQHPAVFACIRIEFETIDHILRAAKDISSLHILPAQVALKQAKFKLAQWKEMWSQRPQQGLFAKAQSRFPCCWLDELHAHLLAKFCLFFYAAFTDLSRADSLREQEFSRLAEHTRYDFKTQCINFMEKHAARTVYLIRDHNPLHDRRNKYSSTSRYVFLPFVEDVIQEDAKLKIGIVSRFGDEQRDYQNMVETHEKYVTNLHEEQVFLGREQVELEITLLSLSRTFCLENLVKSTKNWGPRQAKRHSKRQKISLSVTRKSQASQRFRCLAITWVCWKQPTF